jgi:hypothetical protein
VLLELDATGLFSFCCEQSMHPIVASSSWLVKKHGVAVLDDMVPMYTFLVALVFLNEEQYSTTGGHLVGSTHVLACDLSRLR